MRRNYFLWNGTTTGLWICSSAFSNHFAMDKIPSPVTTDFLFILGDPFLLETRNKNQEIIYHRKREACGVLRLFRSLFEFCRSKAGGRVFSVWRPPTCFTLIEFLLTRKRRKELQQQRKLLEKKRSPRALNILKNDMSLRKFVPKNRKKNVLKNILAFLVISFINVIVFTARLKL